jgi:hypothetical protein
MPVGAFATSPGLPGVADAAGEEGIVDVEAADELLSADVLEGGALATIVGAVSWVAGGARSFGVSAGAAGGTGAAAILDDSLAATDCFDANMR